MLDTKGKLLIIDRALVMRFVINCKISFSYVKTNGMNGYSSEFTIPLKQ